jgi:adenine-specific DNA-methyltransferase
MPSGGIVSAATGGLPIGSNHWEGQRAMAKRRNRGTDIGGNGGTGAGRRDVATDYRFPNKRTNNPPATLAAEGTVPAIPKAKYEYSPRLPPVLRFDPDGKPDALPDLLAEATRRKLSTSEAKELASALRTQEPWLEWAGKREAKSFEVDPVALHIHERVSAQAILKVAARQDIDHFLFADPEQEYREAVQFYRHSIPWTNRLILGDSLMVMSSLARREDLAGKVQMIYIDPPYGIKFASNFQPEIGKRDVRDKEQDLTREPEMVKAYRDTWQLGVHSYLSYLRDRLMVAKELLADTGSLFVQISDENLHRVRMLIEEVFGQDNVVATITFRTTSSRGGNYLGQSANYLLWAARDLQQVRWRVLYRSKGFKDDVGGRFTRVELADGQRRVLTTEERDDIAILKDSSRIYRHDNLTSQSGGDNSRFPVDFLDMRFLPGRGYWKTNADGFKRLLRADRLGAPTPNSLAYVRFLNDFPVSPFSEVWTDTQTGAFTDDKVYVVQTNTKVIERCMLMTTDPGDLVVDPTCGSGTTAYVAEQWGRRWITMDTSRVAISIARQRLLTAKFDYYELKPPATEAVGGEQFKLDGKRAGAPQGLLPVNDPESPARGFVYKTVPHVTLKSIAQNTNLDPIFAKHEPILASKLTEANNALARVNNETRGKLERKLLLKQQNDGKKSITDGDRRRWELPFDKAQGRPGKWEHWQVPFDVDEDYPPVLAEAVKSYGAAWRAKIDEVNACIAANAEQEELVDQPEIRRGVVRVSGPFTVEAVQPPEMSLGDVAATGTPENSLAFDGEPDQMLTFEMRPVEVGESAQNVAAYLSQMIRLLKSDGVRFPNNKQKNFTRLEPVTGNASGFHAEGRWIAPGETDRDPDGQSNVGVVFGPQYGPVTAPMVEQLIKPASRRYDDLVIAGFSFDGPAQATIEEAQHPKLRIHMAHIRPDVNPGMNGLLKEQPGSQLFTVFGQPRTTLAGPDKDGQYTVTMEGVDIYNPVDNSIAVTGAEKVAAWFLDGDYDGRTFCITQAFFPDRSAWDKLSRALNGPGGVIDAERFEALSGTISLPFPPGKHKCAAVKVIDPRGNEVMRVHRL